MGKTVDHYHVGFSSSNFQYFTCPQKNHKEKSHWFQGAWDKEKVKNQTTFSRMPGRFKIPNRGKYTSFTEMTKDQDA